MFQLDVENLKINKVFIELRHKDNFSLPNSEKRFKLLEKLTEKYPEYNIESPEKLSFFAKDGALQIHVHINRLIIDWNNPPSLNDFFKVAKPVINDVINVFNLEPIRIGVRTFLTKRLNNQKEINDYIINKYLNPNAKSFELIADEILNPRVQFTGRKGNLMYNFAVTYQHEQIIEGNIMSPTQTINHNFMVDIDTFKDHDINLRKLDNFFNKTNDLVTYKVKQYLKKVEG